MNADLEQAIADHQTAKARHDRLTQTLADFREELATLEALDSAERREAARRLLMTGESVHSATAGDRIARIAAIKAALAESDALLREAALAESDAWKAVQASLHGMRLEAFNAAAAAFQPVKAAFAALLTAWAEYRGLNPCHVEAVFSDLMFNQRDVLI